MKVGKLDRGTAVGNRDVAGLQVEDCLILLVVDHHIDGDFIRAGDNRRALAFLGRVDGGVGSLRRLSKGLRDDKRENENGYEAGLGHERIPLYGSGPG